MVIRVKYLLCAVVLICATSCRDKAGSAAIEDEVIFNFVQLNDVYEIAPLGGGLYGGMARVAYVVDSLKAINPNTYLFMSGDFLNPSLLGNVKFQGSRIKGRQMIEVMNAMDFTMVTFGNHEFDLSYASFAQRLNESSFDWVNANCYHDQSGVLSLFQRHRGALTDTVPQTKILSIESPRGTPLKVGFFGVTIPSNPKPYVHYADMFEQASWATQQLQNDDVDMIVALTHLEKNMDLEIARQNPNIDLILGGHEHNHMLLQSGQTVIAKSDANAKNIYVHQVRYGDSRKSWQIESKLLPITNKTPENQHVAAIVRKWDKVLQQELGSVLDDPNTVIYQAKTPLDGRDKQSRSEQTNLGMLITTAMAASFDPPLGAAIVNGGSMRLDDYLSGGITAIDLFRVLPFGDGILQVELSGALLKEVLNYGESQKGEGAYLQRYGMTKDASDRWNYQGTPIVDYQKYWIAASEYLLRGFDIPFLTPDHPEVYQVLRPNTEDLSADIRKSIIHYLNNSQND